MADRPDPSPEGQLITREMKRQRVTARQLAPQVGITEARLRQIANGYQAVGGGNRIPAIAKPVTLARIALALGITADQLRGIGRADAADEMADLGPAADTLAALSAVDDAAVAEVMERADITEGDKRKLVELLLAARRADDDRRLELARQLLDVWWHTEAS